MREEREVLVLNFPPCRQALDAEMGDQLCKVIDEWGEAMEELPPPGLAWVSRASEDMLLDELLDTMHALEGCLRKFPPERLDEAKARVIEKNRARGYY